MKTSLRRSLGVVITACALLFAMATPASATIITATITGGTVTVAKTGQTTQINSLGTGTCPSGSISADATGTSTGTFVITVISITEEFFWNGIIFVSIITLRSGSVSGTYSHATGIMSGLVVPVQARLYTKASACTAGTLLCTWNTNLGLGSTNLTSHTVSSTATLNGTGTALALGGACAAPFSTYTGGSVTVSGMTAHVTS